MKSYISTRQICSRICIYAKVFMKHIEEKLRNLLIFSHPRTKISYVFFLLKQMTYKDLNKKTFFLKKKKKYFSFI